MPSITLSSDYLPSVVLSGSVLVTITPSESLLSVGSGGLSIVGGVLASFTQSGSLSNYRVMAPSNTQSGSLQVTFDTGSLTDLVGNPLLGQTTRSWSYDTRFPTLVSQSWTATGTTAVGFTARHSFVYDEGVSTTLRVFSGATNILTRNQTSSGSNHTLDNTVFSLDGGRSYTYEILAADRVGNTITSTGGFLVPHDSSPDRFGFGSVNTPLLANPVSSSTGIVTGITGSIPVSIVGGLYQIDNGALTSLPGSVSSGAIITLQLTSGGTVGEIRTATLSLGDLQIPFSVTTISTGAPIPSSGGGGGGGGGSSFTIFGPSISTPVSTIDTGKSVSGGATIKNPPALPTCTVYSTIPRTLKASDITGHWAEISIRKSLSKGYLLNTRSVQPNSGMTRIAFVSFLARVYPCEGFGVASKLSWSDVPKGSTLEENLKRFAAKGWMNGSGGKFRPNDQITRREALEVIARILGIPASSSGVSQFGDLQK